ncbi:hypothetical protein ACROYT_G044002 [Oculina patagonica]
MMLDIATREAIAVNKVLHAFKDLVKDCRVDVMIDNLAVMYAWNNQGGKGRDLNNAIKALFFTTMDLNILLHMLYVPSQENPADAPSRRLSSLDYTLTSEIWNEVQLRFGGGLGHTCDLMALDSNAMPDRLGRPLPHFTPFPSPGSIGVNLLAQDLTQFSTVMQRPYVFPPNVLVGPVLRFLQSYRQPCTIVVLDTYPRKYWWPLLQRFSRKAQKLAGAGDSQALLSPSKKVGDLPIVAKLFTPSVRCPKCSHANDQDFRFCQRCGYNRQIVTPFHIDKTDIDLKSIDQRLRQLMDFDRATSYAKQKDSLRKEFETFLASLPGHITLATVTPRDICRFLVFKDKNGKTQIHRTGCKYLGQAGRYTCGCPVRLSYKTVDSYIGKLRAILHSIGRDGEWDKRLGLGNPASDKSVKDFLRLVTAEQLQARVTPRQATPFFVDKLTQLCSHLDKKLRDSDRAIDRFVIARDQAYFKLVFFSGDRPGDLGQIKVPEILRFPNDDGLLFYHIWGKTLRDGDENVFGVRRNTQVEICPVRGIERYMEVTRDIRVDLTRGYLFRPITPDLGIKDTPFTSSAAESRLKGYLKEMNADNGETLHGFRSGCAITLALTGADLAEIMDHVGWTRRHTALYYMQLAKVLNPAGASARLASNIGTEPSCSWQDINQLKRFVCAFPAVDRGKRSYEQERL